jgi:hypothetical protein
VTFRTGFKDESDCLLARIGHGILPRPY